MSKESLFTEPTETSEPYWNAIDDERFELQHCHDCDTWIYYPRPICPSCGNGDPEWEEASGEGTIHTYTVLHVAPVAGYSDETPYVLATIELAEGPRMMTNVVNCDPRDVEIGDDVTVTFEDRGDRNLPQFEPASR